jgi:uncharacterized membrane protein
MQRRLILVLVILAVLAVGALAGAGFTVGTSWGGVKTTFAGY